MDSCAWAFIHIVVDLGYTWIYDPGYSFLGFHNLCGIFCSFLLPLSLFALSFRFTWVWYDNIMYFRKIGFRGVMN